MKFACFICCLFFLSFSSIAQSMETLTNEDGFLKNADGSFIQKTTTFNEEGFSSLPQKNCVVILKTKGGKVFNKVNGRIDLLTEGLIFTVREQDMMCALPIEQLLFDSCDAALSGALFKTGYPAVDKQTEKSLYQVLSQGKATLLKHYSVKFQDITPFNNTNTTRTYTQMQHYYLFLNGKMVSLEKNNTNLPELISSAKDYLSANKLNLKKEADVTKLVDYYNSL
jgi:hypothetical protein